MGTMCRGNDHVPLEFSDQIRRVFLILLFVVKLKAYVDFVNNIVIEGFVAAISVSMQYVCELLDPVAISRQELQQH